MGRSAPIGFSSAWGVAPTGCAHPLTAKPKVPSAPTTTTNAHAVDASGSAQLAARVRSRAKTSMVDATESARLDLRDPDNHGAERHVGAGATRLEHDR